MNRLFYHWLKFSAMACLVLGLTRRAQEIFNQMLRAGPTTPMRWPAGLTCTRKPGGWKPRWSTRNVWWNCGPTTPAPGSTTASCWNSAGRYDEALAAFRRATELGPKLDRAWYGMGLVLIRLQRYEEAVQALKRNTELQPMSPYGWYQLARVHVDRHQPEEAVKIIRHLQKFEPKDRGPAGARNRPAAGPAAS